MANDTSQKPTISSEQDHEDEQDYSSSSESSTTTNVVSIPSCEDRAKALEAATQAGEILQAMFYEFLQRTWVADINVCKYADICTFGEPRDDIVRHFLGNGQPKRVFVLEDLGDGPCSNRDHKRAAGGWLLQSAGVFEGSEEAKRILLADGNSFWAFVFLNTAVRCLFQDLVNNVDTDIKEVQLLPKAQVHKLASYEDAHGNATTRWDQPYRDDNIISAFEILLKTGQRLAIHLGHAQYRVRSDSIETVMLWSRFWRIYGSEILERNPFGTAYSGHIHLMTGADKCSHLHVATYIMREVDEWLATYLSGWTPRHPTYFTHWFTTFLSLHAAQVTTAIRTIDTHITGPFLNLYNSFTHPILRRKSLFHKAPRDLVLPGLADLKHFEWDTVKELAGNKNLHHEVLSEAQQLKKQRALFQPFGDWRMNMLPDPDVLPATGVRGE